MVFLLLSESKTKHDRKTQYSITESYYYDLVIRVDSKEILYSKALIKYGELLNSITPIICYHNLPVLYCFKISSSVLFNWIEIWQSWCRKFSLYIYFLHNSIVMSKLMVITSMWQIQYPKFKRLLVTCVTII